MVGACSPEANMKVCSPPTRSADLADRARNEAFGCVQLRAYALAQTAGAEAALGEKAYRDCLSNVLALRASPTGAADDLALAAQAPVWIREGREGHCWAMRENDWGGWS